MSRLTHVLTISTILLGSLPVEATDTQIDIRNYKFAPESVTITAGDKVTWINRDQIPHGIADKNKTFRSGALDTNDNYSFTYKTPGVYPYFCTLHPYMTGTITVTQKGN